MQLHLPQQQHHSWKRRSRQLMVMRWQLRKLHQTQQQQERQLTGRSQHQQERPGLMQLVHLHPPQQQQQQQQQQEEQVLPRSRSLSARRISWPLCC
jgi:hypothetical protein